MIVWPVLVQGQGAAEQVAGAVRGFSELPRDHPDRPDLVIVARGGGSIEDLWSFNEEIVVRAIAECSIPTISAVGHETDTTLADYAADRRAPTPTAAAEMAVPVRAELAAFLGDLSARTRSAILRPVSLGRERLAARADRLPRIETLLQPKAQKLDELAERLRRGLTDRAAQGRERLAQLRISPAALTRTIREARERLERQRLVPALVERPLADRRERLVAIARLAEQLHPDRPLQRGYVRVTAQSGATVTTRASAAKEESLGLHFADGVLDVAPLGAAPAKATPRKPTRKSAPKKGTPPAQDDLFG